MSCQCSYLIKQLFVLCQLRFERGVAGDDPNYVIVTLVL